MIDGLPRVGGKLDIVHGDVPPFMGNRSWTGSR
jgi:hypothetical protein